MGMPDCRYEQLNAAQLPPLWLILANRPSDSGKIHAPVRKLWEAGDPAIRAAMSEVASMAEMGRSCYFILAVYACVTDCA